MARWRFTFLFFVAFGIYLGLSPLTASAANYGNINIIDDSIMNNTSAMSTSQIDTFLNSFTGSCIGSASGFTTPKPLGFSGSSWQYGSNVSAGEAIKSIADRYNLNPQVLIATLEKEQGLVSRNNDCHSEQMGDAPAFYSWSEHKACSSYATPYPDCVNVTCGNSTTYSDCSYACKYSGGCITVALGYSCPGFCKKSFANFSGQISGGAWVLRFAEARAYGQLTGYSGYDDGDEFIHYSGPMTPGYRQRVNGGTSIYYDGLYTDADGHTMYVTNGSTASMLSFTPFYARSYTADKLFNTFFTKWFGSTTRSKLFKISGDSTYYLEWGTYYYAIPDSETLSAYGLERIAPRTISTFPSGKMRGATLQRVAKFGSDNPQDANYTQSIYLVDNGKRHEAPNWFTLGHHGYNTFSRYDSSLSFLLNASDPLRPVVRSENSPTIYLMENSLKRGFPDSEAYQNLSGPNYNNTLQIYGQQSITRMSSAYINSKATGLPMLLDGKILSDKSSPAIYLFNAGQKYIFSPEAYSAWGNKSDFSLSSTMLGQIPSSGKAPLYIKSSNGTKYLVNSSKKMQFTDSMLTKWGKVDGDFEPLANRTVSKLTTANNVTPLVKDRNPGVYYLEDGVKHGITSISDFTKLGFKWSDVITIDNKSLASFASGAILYAPGSLVRTPDGTVHLVIDGYVALGISSESVFNHYRFSWGSVRNIPSSSLTGYSKSSLQTLVKNSATNTFYIADNGLLRVIDDDAMSSAQYNFASSPYSSLDIRLLKSLKSSAKMTRYIKGGQTTVYYVENGQKRPFSSEATFFSKGGTWATVTNVSNDLLSKIPTGANL
jgi:hypothetical protein